MSLACGAQLAHTTELSLLRRKPVAAAAAATTAAALLTLACAFSSFVYMCINNFFKAHFSSTPALAQNGFF
jgi:hypothetical protein